MVDELNSRFRRGKRDGAALAEFGVFLHQFDFMDDDNPSGRPWQPGAGTWIRPDGQRVSSADRGDRISAALINAQMTPEIFGSAPIYSLSLAGLVLSPQHNTLLCSYAYDVDSLERTCSPPGLTSSCTPGCTHPRGGHRAVNWCSSTRREAVDDEWPCAWRPSETHSMLLQREALREAEPWFKPAHKRFVRRPVSTQPRLWVVTACFASCPSPAGQLRVFTCWLTLTLAGSAPPSAG